MENYNFIFTKLQQLEGGGENEEMHEVLNNFRAAWKGAWQHYPYFENLL